MHHDFADRHLALAAHDPAQFACANGLMLRIDDENFPEFCGQVLVIAQIIDELTNGHMFRHRDQFALHDTASGFVGIRQSIFNDGAVFGVQLGQNGLLVLRLHIFDNRNRVIGIQLSGKSRHLRRRQGVDDVLADIIVDLGQHLGAHEVAQADGEYAAPFGWRQFEQVGNVGFVQRFDKPVDFVEIAVLDRIENAVDIVARQAIVFVQHFHDFGVNDGRVGDVAGQLRASRFSI